MSESFSKNDDPFRCGVSDSGSVDHSSGDHSERGVGGRGSEIDAKRIRDLAQGEITGLFTWRLIVVAVILVTYASVTAASYMFLNNLLLFDDKESYLLFAHSFEQTATQQFAEFQTGISTMASAVNGNTADITNSGTQFPFVNLPRFEISGHEARVRSGAEAIAWNPFVEESETEAWNAYIVKAQGWYNESLTTARILDSTAVPEISQTTSMHEFIWHIAPGVGATPAQYSGPYAPMWHCSPPPPAISFVNFDTLSEASVKALIPALMEAKDGVMSTTDVADSGLGHLMQSGSELPQYTKTQIVDRPYSFHVQPVFENLYDRESRMVGFLSSLVYWDVFMTNVLPEEVHNIIAILRNSCRQSFTFRVDGQTAIYLGEGDMHDRDHDDTELMIPLRTYGFDETSDMEGHCMYSISLYFSDNFSYEPSNLAKLCAVALVIIFVIMAGTFFMYDRFVRRRSVKVELAAARSNAVISSFFPTQVRQRLLAEKANIVGGTTASKSQLRTLINSGNCIDDYTMDDDDDDSDFMYKTKPIADLFPETTILFADISGFTAWSSVREPAQVFILLETLFQAFDNVAKKRRVFKVETVGDCYVAVTGLPDPRPDHAVAMCRFAKDCVHQMRSLSQKLECTLGPDTGDLAMRMGMHSGPVTAGVLRGERSRFQLFGDTMNTAARMEHTGVRDKIQLSPETANLLIAAGKGKWVVKRDDVVHAKGKGDMQTFWLDMVLANEKMPPSTFPENVTDSLAGQVKQILPPIATDCEEKGKVVRLIEWNVDVLLRLIKQIVAWRQSCTLPSNEFVHPVEARFDSSPDSKTLDEVKEIIKLPKFKEVNMEEDPEKVEVDPDVVAQLHDFVSKISCMYRENAFHNFEHASHVAMSVTKLLSRIVAPSEHCKIEENSASTFHDHTYGITSDPLTQFSCVFSAIIHDVDHAGVPNAQLVLEQATVAEYYSGKSVAEQNSVDIAWKLLMEDQYAKLRQTIYVTDEELKRFRQLVVNSVMATDIVDKELKNLRNLRWDRAFSSLSETLNNSDTVDRKATIVIEHLIQASDVAHTMQHWHVYRKWNERFFQECHQAFIDGRAEKNPADSWYEGEIGFFDFYIIPLARKLKDCGVFGVSSDEYYTYAISNREEWKIRGRDVVSEMVAMVKNQGSTMK